MNVLQYPRTTMSLFICFCVYVGTASLLWGARLVGMPTLMDIYRHPFIMGAENPTWHGSPLGPIIGNLLGIGDKLSIYLFFLSIIAAAIVALFFFIRHIAKHDTRLTTVLLAILALSPLLNVLFSWVGLSDPLLLLAYLGFLVAPSALLENGTVMLMFLAHREQAAMIIVLHLILNPAEWRRIVRIVPGIILVAVWFYFYTWILGGFENRLDVMSAVVNSFHAIPPQAIAMTVVLIFGWFWIVLAHVGTIINRPQRWRLAFVIGIITVFSSVLTLDNTRVAAMLSLPVYFFVLRTYAERSVRMSTWLILLCLLLGLIQIEASAWMPLFRNWWWFQIPLSKI